MAGTCETSGANHVIAPRSIAAQCYHTCLTDLQKGAPVRTVIVLVIYKTRQVNCLYLSLRQVFPRTTDLFSARFAKLTK